MQAEGNYNPAAGSGCEQLGLGLTPWRSREGAVMQEERGSPQPQRRADCEAAIDKKYAFDHSTDKIYFYVFVFAPDSQLLQPLELPVRRLIKGSFVMVRKVISGLH